jgi:hypothetical protein
MAELEDGGAGWFEIEDFGTKRKITKQGVADRLKIGKRF